MIVHRSQLLCATAVFVAGACAADSPWLYGIHWFGPQTNNSDVRAMTGNKGVWSQETVMTADGQGQWGPEGQLARFQNIVAEGHTIVLRVQPVWGKAFPWPEDTNPSMSTFLDQVSHTATLYKDLCHIWFLGNEMNLDSEWGGRHLQPEDYIEAAVQFSDRVKAVAGSRGPQRVLVGPPGVGDNLGGALWMSCTEYLNRMCAAINNRGYRNRFDGFAIHSYAFPDIKNVDACLAQFESAPGIGYRYQIGLIDNHGFVDWPIYITEWNRYTGSSADEAVSAQFLYRAFAGIHAWNQENHPIACACWYIYHDWGGWGGYSIRSLKSSGTRDEDVWHAFQYACGQNYPAAYPAVSPTPSPTPTRPALLLQLR